MRGGYFGVWFAIIATAAIWSAPAQAKVNVVVSIPPAHSLVAQVMEGVGEPELILSNGASPHHFSLRPSDARALNQAGLVFWIGPAFEGWMVKPVASLPKSAQVVALSEIDSVSRLSLREGGVWEAHDHDHHGDDAHAHDGGHHHHHKKHSHKKHDHAKRNHGDHGSHKKAERGGSQLDAFSVDQHYWLDPQNASAWIEEIARVLVQKDPANGERYKANAARALQELAALEREIAEIVKPVRDKPFIVFHDAYQHFEQRFGVTAVGSISLPDAGAPGPARLAEVRDKIKELGAVCVFTEPQFPQKLARMATGGTAARIGELDPLGASTPAGAGLYKAVMLDLANDLKACLAA